MNQQRTRRFKAAKERADKAAEAAALRSELKAQGRIPPPPSDKPGFDSNVITPGTEFMDALAQWLRYYAAAFALEPWMEGREGDIERCVGTGGGRA